LRKKDPKTGEILLNSLTKAKGSNLHHCVLQGDHHVHKKKKNKKKKTGLAKGLFGDLKTLVESIMNGGDKVGREGLDRSALGKRP